MSPVFLSRGYADNRLPSGPEPFGPPLLELRPPSTYRPALTIAILVRRSLHALGALSARQPTTLDLEVFVRNWRLQVLEAPVRSVLGVTPPTEYYRLPATALMVACHAAPLMRFVAPSALSTCRVHSTRACLTRYVPPPGFRTLMTAYSSTDYPALFHAGALMEFLSLQSVPLVRSRDASQRPLPSCR